MLIRVTIENFLSFAERTEFSMLPGKGRLNNHHIIKDSSKNGISVLKSAIVYGANASGKSNFVKAVAFARDFILRGTQTDNQKIDFKPFRLSKELIGKPSRIEFEIRSNGNNYAYGFTFNNDYIIEEWLYEINSKKDRAIFDRKRIDTKYDTNLKGIKEVNEKERQFLEFTANGTRRNQLFLTECLVRNVKDNVSSIGDVLNVYNWFQHSLSIIYPNTKYAGVEFELKSNEEMSRVFHEFLDYFNTGIKGISLEMVDFDKIADIPDEVRKNVLSSVSKTSRAFLVSPDGLNYSLVQNEDGGVDVFKMMTRHSISGTKKEEKFEISEESHGTQRIIDFIPAIIELFKNDNVFIIDEIDRSLHPNLTYDLIDLFLSKSSNIRSQLIVTTHESGLLSQKLVRKDEVWFVVKNEQSATQLYSLEEYKVRFDKELRRDYLLGRYKAVPVLGNRNNLSIINTAVHGS